MRNRIIVAVAFAAGVIAPLSAHIMVSPPQSKSGAAQKYEVRVHNEAAVAVTAIDLDIPDGVVVTDVAQPAKGTFTTQKAGERIDSITWHIDVQPNKYLAFPFTATNPAGASELHWSVREHLADGSVVDWSDKPGSKEKGSVTKLVAGPK